MKRIRAEQLQTTTLLYLKKRNFTDSESTFKQNIKFTSTPIEAASSLFRNNLSSSLDVVAMACQNLDEYFEAYNLFQNFVSCTIEKCKYDGLKQLVFPVFVHAYLDLLNAGRIKEAEEFYDLFFDEKSFKSNKDIIIELHKIKKMNDVLNNHIIHQFRNKTFQVELNSGEIKLLDQFLREQNDMIIMKLLNDRFCLIEIENGSSRVLTAIEMLQENFSKNAETCKSVSNDNMSMIISPPSSCAPVTTPTTPQQFVEKDVCNFDVDEVVVKKHINSVKSSKPVIQGLFLYKFLDSNKCLTNASISQNKHLICTCRDDSSLSLWKLSPLFSTLEKFSEVREQTKSIYSKFPDVSTVKFGNEYVNDIDCHASQMSKIKKQQLCSGMTSLLGHYGPVYSSAFSHNDKFLLSCSEDTTIRLWDLEILKNITIYQGHSYPVSSVSVSPLDFYFASGSMDCTCRLWTFERTHPIRIFAGHEQSVEKVAFHGNASYVASADNTVRLWDVNSGKTVRLLVGHWAPVTSLAFSPNGKYLASSGEDCRIRIWDIGTGNLVKEIRSHSDTVYSLSFSADSCLLASCGADSTVCVWSTLTTNTESETPFNTLKSHEVSRWKFQESLNKLLSLDFSGDVLHCIGIK